MKTKLFLLICLLIMAGIQTEAQTKLNLEGGYFGETLTYPGAVFGLEHEKMFTERFSTPMRVNIGFYSHSRSHNALFLSLSQGFRRYFKEGAWYYEQNLGLGVMQSFYPEDRWHIDEHGNVATISSFGNFDFMPSVEFGFGFNLTPKRDKANYLWIRPKVSWQLPFNNLANAHIAMQFGYSYTLKSN